ncbi:filamentous hemagglutinin N-terminal domain-containing protein [Biostraticola tofi]|uniref:Filamentous hemagglutinin family protein n=1 Tax=Biostraticola tofi TaxID=466109 RepID=A0A4R3YZK4_9GAMM|nr:filamentous hemagglutinin N-terminal domain-containing protein [Biostraticola tofi]TCV98740.1 filamentous hemagglutinin family protein [Biostraticola tofi]
MNKHQYRIIDKIKFSLLRGNKGSDGRKGHNLDLGGEIGLKKIFGHGHSAFRLWGIGMFCVLNSIIPSVNAQIVGDMTSPPENQPNIISSDSGTPQIDIQTPGPGGVSRNMYSQFDIDNRGAVLNNSYLPAKTQQGLHINGNPHLANGAADIILNEVHSSDPSRLNGHIEVVGQKAQVIIANPSGITCDGCEFINAHRATLTTGRTLFTEGMLSGYQVEKGNIAIQGDGWLSSAQDYTDIIARSVTINAALWANDLKVTSGRNRVDALHEHHHTLTGDNGTGPDWGLDVSDLGGMYAGKIRLRGTRQGVGVSNGFSLNGEIAAHSGALILTSEGRIENSGTLKSTGDLIVSSQAEILNSGTLLSENDVMLASGNDFVNRNSITSGKHIRINAANLNLDQGAIMIAGIGRGGLPAAEGNILVETSGVISARGLILAAGDVAMKANGISARGGEVQAQNVTLDTGQGTLSTAATQVRAIKNLSVLSDVEVNNDNGTLTGHAISFAAPNISNRHGSIIHTGDEEWVLAGFDSFDNVNGSLKSDGETLSINSHLLNSQKGKITHTGTGSLRIYTNEADFKDAKITSNGLLTVTGNDLMFDGATIDASNIMLKANKFNHRKGRMTQHGSEDMRIHFNQELNNNQGVMLSQGDIFLHGKILNNQSGFLYTEKGDLNIRSLQLLDNRYGMISSPSGTVAVDYPLLEKHNVSVSANATNRQGMIAGRTVLITGDRPLINREGIIDASRHLNINSSFLDNDQGLLRAGEQIIINTMGHPITNRQNAKQGGIISQGVLCLESGLLENDNGLIKSGKALIINTRGSPISSRDNAQYGGIISRDLITIQSGDIYNTYGRITSEHGILLQADQLHNRKGIFGAFKGDLSMRTRTLDNSDGLIQSTGALEINTQGQALINCAEGANDDQSQINGIKSTGKMLLMLGALDNRKGYIRSYNDLSISSSRVDNQQGSLIGNREFSLKTLSPSQPIVNWGGQISGGGNLQILAGELLNQKGVIQSEMSISMNTPEHLIDNRGGMVRALGPIKISSAGFNNQHGALDASGRLELDTPNSPVENAMGLIRSHRAVNLSAVQLNNHATQMPEQGIIAPEVKLLSDRLFNTQGLITASGDLTIICKSMLYNKNGLLTSTGTLTLGADEQPTKLNIINTEGSLKAGHLLWLQGLSLTGKGAIISEGNMMLSVKQSDIGQGEIDVKGNLRFDMPYLMENRVNVNAGGGLTLIAPPDVNQREAETSAGGV